MQVLPTSTRQQTLRQFLFGSDPARASLAKGEEEEEEEEEKKDEIKFATDWVTEEEENWRTLIARVADSFHGRPLPAKKILSSSSWPSSATAKARDK